LDGIAALTCCYCDDDDQNYITKTSSKRLKVPEGPDGKISLTFAWRSGCQSEVRKFSIVSDREIETDVKFGMKFLEESQNSPIDGDDEAASEMGPLGTSLADCISDSGRVARSNGPLNNSTY
jgi:hypothetical protein